MRCNAFVQFEIAFLCAIYNGRPFLRDTISVLCVCARSLRRFAAKQCNIDRQITPLREILCIQFTHFAVIRAVITDKLE